MEINKTLFFWIILPCLFQGILKQLLNLIWAVGQIRQKYSNLSRKLAFVTIYSQKKSYLLLLYNWPRCPLWDECKCGIADKVGTMCHVKYGIMCSLDISRHSRVDYIQYQNYSWITITQILHSDILAWQKNVITVPNSVQNYCKTSQQPAAVLSLMTMTKTVNDISLLEPSTWTTWRCLIQPFMC